MRAKDVEHLEATVMTVSSGLHDANFECVDHAHGQVTVLLAPLSEHIGQSLPSLMLKENLRDHYLILELVRELCQLIDVGLASDSI